MLRLAALLLLVGTLSACDALDGLTDDRADSERIVEDSPWTARELFVTVRNVPVSFPVADINAAGDIQTFDFETDGTFTFRFDPANGRRLVVAYQGTTYVDVPVNQTVSLAGTYELDEDAGEIAFSTVAGQTADDFRLSYDFGPGRDGTLQLTAENAGALSRLFGLASADAAALAEYVTGGLITYSRAGTGA